MKESLFIRWLPVILWGLFIFITSANPNPYRPLPAAWSRQTVMIQSVSGSKRVGFDELLGRFLHPAEYLVLAILIARALVGRAELRFPFLAMAFGLSALYALTDEVHQLYVPRRAFEISDLALDFAGSALGIITFAAVLTIRRQRARRRP
jgi:VanZ family protein